MEKGKQQRQVSQQQMRAGRTGKTENGKSPGGGRGRGSTEGGQEIKGFLRTEKASATGVEEPLSPTLMAVNVREGWGKQKKTNNNA